MPAESAEKYASPVEGELSPLFTRRNEFNEPFRLRWGRIHFDMAWGAEADLKIILKVVSQRRLREVHRRHRSLRYPMEPAQARTRDFFVHPFPPQEGRIVEVRFAFVVHIRGQSIPSRHEYFFMDPAAWDEDRQCRRPITCQG